MHDFAIEKSICVNQPDNFLLSDCGSKRWAYTLFITFNIISMYVFANLFILVMIQEFSLVYKTESGSRLISKEDMENFKRAWNDVDSDLTGFIQKKDLARFLGVSTVDAKARDCDLQFE